MQVSKDIYFMHERKRRERKTTVRNHVIISGEIIKKTLIVWERGCTLERGSNVF